MSFELFMQCYDRERPAGASENAVRAAFTNFANDSDPDYWHVVYDDANNCNIAVSRDENDTNRITALTVHRPCGDDRLWDSFFRVLSLGPWVLFFPAENPPLIVSDRANAEHLPRDMRKSLGPIREVRSGEEIRRIVKSS